MYRGHHQDLVISRRGGKHNMGRRGKCVQTTSVFSILVWRGQPACLQLEKKMSHGPKHTLPPSGFPEELSSAEQSDAYRRRMNRTTMPLRIQRMSSVISTFGVTCELQMRRCALEVPYIAELNQLIHSCSTQVLAMHAIFFADFGNREHVFSPVSVVPPFWTFFNIGRSG